MGSRISLVTPGVDWVGGVMIGRLWTRPCHTNGMLREYTKHSDSRCLFDLSKDVSSVVAYDMASSAGWRYAQVLVWRSGLTARCSRPWFQCKFRKSSMQFRSIAARLQRALKSGAMTVVCWEKHLFEGVQLSSNSRKTYVQLSLTLAMVVSIFQQ